jgi:hypothetical protein
VTHTGQQASHPEEEALRLVDPGWRLRLGDSMNTGLEAEDGLKDVEIESGVVLRSVLY